MNPKIEIPVTLGNGRIERWGLAVDDGCVVVLRYEEHPDHNARSGWMQQRRAYVPAYVAVHMSALAQEYLAQQAAAEAVVYSQTARRGLGNDEYRAGLASPDAHGNGADR